MAKQFQVNQTLFFVPRDQGKPCEVTIVKVGRKWLELSNFKRCNFDLVVDSPYGTPLRCYLSRAVYEQGRALSAAWSRLKYAMPHNAPEGMTIEQITQARAMLGL